MKPANTLQYKNYTASVVYTNAKDSLTGKVLGMNDLPAFSARTVDGLKDAFHQTIDEYLLDCQEKHTEPARAFTGNITIRIEPSAHEALSLYAISQGVVLTKVLKSAIYEYLENHDIQVADGEG